MRILACFVMLFFIACDSSGPNCAELDEAGCEAAAECRASRGGPAAEYCANDLTNFATIYAGCVTNEQPCGGAETCGIDPDTGDRLFFADTCLPEGWGSCDCSIANVCEQDIDPTGLGQICVRGRTGSVGESIEVDSPLIIEATPTGCFSSGCVVVMERVCGAAVTGSDIALDSLFCLGPADVDNCLPDCSGAGFATCQTEPLAVGSYTLTAGDLSVTFDVPSEIPFGGTCAGDPSGQLP